MLKIIGVDNLARDTVADRLVAINIPDVERPKAEEFCDWLNQFSCYDHGGTFHRVVADDYRLSLGMEDLV